MEALQRIWDFSAYTLLPFIVVLGIMIFVHEFGHFIAARAIGVRVLVFKLGFGRFIFSFQRGHTEYGVGWIPLGGYVRLFGDPTEIEGEDQDTPLEEIPAEERKEALYFKPAGQKLLVFAAGPIMNIILAFLIAPLLFMIGVPRVPPVVGALEKDSPAFQAGLRPGDRVVEIQGSKVSSFDELKMIEAMNPEQTLTYTVLREGERLSFQVRLKKLENENTGPLGDSGIQMFVPSVVGAVEPGSPAEAAGLKPGDTIIQAGSAKLKEWSELVKEVGESGGKELEIQVLREGRTLTFRVKPRWREEYKRYLIGIAPLQKTEIVRYGPLDSLKQGAAYCWKMVVVTCGILWKLITLELSPKVVAGPLGIGAVVGAAARGGLAPLLGLVVLISINLGILNLLPFPPLDGGHILFTGLEAVTRREINIKYKELTFRMGFALLIILMVLVTMNDFFRYKTEMWKFIRDIGKGLGIG